MTPTATASSSPAAAVSWCWKNWNHALARGAKIYAEVTGYGATSDGHDMVAPSGEGGERAMRLALSTLPQGRKIDYINSHGTSTPVGDVTEVEAIRRVFGQGLHPAHRLDQIADRPLPWRRGRVGGDLFADHDERQLHRGLGQCETLDPALDPSEIVTTMRDGVTIDSVLSNSFGFGGTNATLVMSKYRGTGRQGTSWPNLMKGKRGLVMGVANERSIAWGIASALAAEGAELAFSYQGEAFGKRVPPWRPRSGRISLSMST
jgi:hypothetical protein